MSDVLFDTGTTRSSLLLAKSSQDFRYRPRASRLTLQIEGHTDSVGTDDFNQAFPNSAPAPFSISSLSKVFAETP